MGADALAGEPGPGAVACQGQPGRARCGRHDHGGTCPVAARALGICPPGAGRGHVPAVAGPPGGHPQARGRAVAGGAYLPGPADPAGYCAGAHAHLRPWFLRVVVRVPSRPVRPPGGAGRAAVHPGRPGVGRGHRPGPVLRPGSVRCADGAGGAQGGRPQGPGAHPEVSGGRGDGRRDQAGDGGGDPAGFSAVADFVECHAG